MKIMAMALILGATPALAHKAEDAALLKAEDARFRAELTHDAATLDRMTAPEVTYTHFNGRHEDKASVMQSFTHLPFTAIEPTDRHARLYGQVGIVRGLVARQLPDRRLFDAYIAVYVRRDGRWQLVDWVSHAPPPASPKVD
jgi:hypothetical protein